MLLSLITFLQVSGLECDSKTEFVPSTDTYEFQLMPVPYGYTFLEPFLTSTIIYAHHDHHHQTYYDKLNSYLEDYPDLQGLTLVELQTLAKDDPTLQKHAGGAYNHNLYWNLFTSPECVKAGPEGALYDKIVEQWESFEAFRDEFNTNQMNIFGSGWVWACVDSENKILIQNSVNQINPLMGIDSSVCYPFFGNDIWEHAYYLKYMWDRTAYIDAFWTAIDWDLVEVFYENYSSQLIAIPL